MLEPNEQPLYDRPRASCNKGNGLGVALDVIVHKVPAQYTDAPYTGWRINITPAVALELVDEILAAVKLLL